VRPEACIGCLLGTAVGDALGLPYEGMRPERGRRLFPDMSRHHFVLGRGMVSDDTEHACFVAQGLIRARGDVDAFERHLAGSLRWWLLGLPAGIGKATLRACIRLWLGLGPKRSGVFSAGNGPAMRSPILGVTLGDSPDTLKTFVRASTQITHGDPKAFFGAMAVALAAHHSVSRSSISATEFFVDLVDCLSGEEADEFFALIEKAVTWAAKNDPVSDLADQIGSSGGISGYIYHTVPCVIGLWLRHPDDYAAAVTEIIAAGGDTDTTAAILGGIVGARVGAAGIPKPWVDGLLEWPRTVAWMQALSRALASAVDGDEHVTCPGYFWPGVVPRNALFLACVLAHGFRRLAPPY